MTSDMSLNGTSTASGIIWTKPCGDDHVQAVLPIVQYHAADQLVYRSVGVLLTPYLFLICVYRSLSPR